MLVILIMRRRRPPPPPPRKGAWWADPAMLAAALDVGRTLGRNKRVTAAVLAGAFVLGILLNRAPRKPDDSQSS